MRAKPRVGRECRVACSLKRFFSSCEKPVRSEGCGKPGLNRLSLKIGIKNSDRRTADDLFFNDPNLCIVCQRHARFPCAADELGLFGVKVPNP